MDDMPISVLLLSKIGVSGEILNFRLSRLKFLNFIINKNLENVIKLKLTFYDMFINWDFSDMWETLSKIMYATDYARFKFALDQFDLFQPYIFS